jgi:hypothetical protein
MASDGAGYFADGMFHANFWHPDYWAEAGAAPPAAVITFTTYQGWLETEGPDDAP